jgi:hypothetical protein
MSLPDEDLDRVTFANPRLERLPSRATRERLLHARALDVDPELGEEEVRREGLLLPPSPWRSSTNVWGSCCHSMP